MVCSRHVCVRQQSQVQWWGWWLVREGRVPRCRAPLAVPCPAVSARRLFVSARTLVNPCWRPPSLQSPEFAPP